MISQSTGQFAARQIHLFDAGRNPTGRGPPAPNLVYQLSSVSTLCRTGSTRHGSEAARGRLMARIFITYARENRAEVEALTADLGRLGHDVWYDAEIRGGQHWWAEILRRIAGSDIYVFAMTEPAIDSRPCMAELDYAVATARPLLPVQVETVSPALLPRALAEAQFVDYRSADKDSVFALNSALNTMPAQTPLPDPMPPPPEIPPDPVAQAKARIDDPTEMTRSTQV